ncbi:MAG: dihydroneopterin aldolase [Bacteroidia bacterium]|nr:dihydroneopterin aldolase [Bacteroidia bacterium]NNJ55113.1 dihydroneopterin aldolase [Bacteroidia bacterium]
MSRSLETTLSINTIRVKAYHGWYASERKLGGMYSISINVYANVDENENFEDLEESVNYENIYSNVIEIMQKEFRLIESCCKAIHDNIRRLKPNAVWEVTIVKENPPIKFVGSTSYTIKG